MWGQGGAGGGAKADPRNPCIASANTARPDPGKAARLNAEQIFCCLRRCTQNIICRPAQPWLAMLAARGRQHGCVLGPAYNDSKALKAALDDFVTDVRFTSYTKETSVTSEHVNRPLLLSKKYQKMLRKCEELSPTFRFRAGCITKALEECAQDKTLQTIAHVSRAQ